MLEAEESLRSLAAALGERLIKDGYDKRASGDFEQTHQEHRKRCQRKRSPVRLYVSKESLKIAHQQLGNTRNEGSRAVQWKDWKTVVSLKENYTYGCATASRMRSFAVPLRLKADSSEFSLFGCRFANQKTQAKAEL